MRLWHFKVMKRCLFLLILLVFTFTSSYATAQTEIDVRGYEREDYSRVVFQVDGEAGSISDIYTIENFAAGEIHIIFKSEQNKINIDIDALDNAALKNIGTVQKLADQPQTISLTIPKTSKVRDFTIGNRILLDIYAPEDAKELEALKKQTAQKQAEPVKKEPAKQKAVKEDEKPLETAAKQLQKPVAVTEQPAPEKPVIQDKAIKETEPAPTQIELVPVKQPKATEKQKPKPIKQEKANNPAEMQKERNLEQLKKVAKQQTHVISFRSTSSFAMSVFESFGDLWFVVYDTQSYILPGITSPTPEIFQGFDRMETENAVIYKTPNPDKNLHVRAKGGNLSWDLILGSDMDETKTVKPRRNTERTRGLQNGSYLWPLSSVAGIIDFEEPETGRELKIVLVNSAVQQTGKFQSFAEFDVLTSHAGMVIYPKVDDLTVTQTGEGIEISRASGRLSVASQQDITTAEIFHSRQEKYPFKNTAGEKNDAENHNNDHQANSDESRSLFKFHTWQLDSTTALNKKENTLLAGLKTKEPGQKVEDILTLGKMMLSHTRGAEALGYFEYAADELPAIESSAEFRALRGAAQAFDWKSEAALTDLLHPDLKDIDEARLWRAYVLADLGDWNQAANALPKSYKALYIYPFSIAHRLALGVAEVNLRDGNVKQADELLGLVGEKQNLLNSSAKAYYDYLRGESFRQKGEEDRATEIWQSLTQNDDDLFRTKAGLALTILMANQGKINAEQTIDRLERLRYAWRGDELEANVNYWLGDAYFQEKKYIKGLSIMRDAASLAENDVLAQRITTDMTKTFASMYLSPELKNVSALDAVAVYEEFSELTPPGDQGDRLVQMLAEHLVGADLLGRASKLLQYQVDHRLSGKEKLKIAVRLAAIELLDKNPQKAIDALSKAEATLRVLSDSPENQSTQREIDLLRIRAYSQNKQYNRAMSLIEKLPQSANVSRLKADVAWQAGYWEEAASALNEVMVEQKISDNQTLTDEQAALILNRAIALNLSGDRIGLANMRTKYGSLMQPTTKSNQFEVITRVQKTGVLADRETLLSAVSEVDMFKDFLESYRNQK